MNLDSVYHYAMFQGAKKEAKDLANSFDFAHNERQAKSNS